AAAGFGAAERLRLVEADKDADNEIGREADEPGVAPVIGGAGFAGERHTHLARGGAGAALDDAFEHRDHLIGGLRAFDLFAIVREFRRHDGFGIFRVARGGFLHRLRPGFGTIRAVAVVGAIDRAAEAVL